MVTLEEYEAREERWNMETATRVAAALYFVMAVKDRIWTPGDAGYTKNTCIECGVTFKCLYHDETSKPFAEACEMCPKCFCA